MIAFEQKAGAPPRAHHRPVSPTTPSRPDQAGVAADYLPALDGLRAVSILLVVISHLGLSHVVPGAFGVTLFFFISGFLITRQLRGALAAEGRVDFGAFYARRALRLMPAGCCFIAVAGLAYLAEGGRLRPAEWAAALLYGANYYDLWTGLRSVVPGVRHPFNILWSLAIEEHFYLLWPACLALSWRRGRAAFGCAAVCAGVLAWRAWLMGACFGGADAPLVCGPVNPNPLWAFNRLYLATDARLDSIAWGALLALAPPGWASGRRMAGLGAVLLVASFAWPRPEGRYVLRPSLQGAALLLLLPSAIAASSPAAPLLCSAPLRLIGRLSYSLYLWHWMALGVADRLVPGGGPVWAGLGTCLSAVLCCASYWGVERPMLRLRRRFGSLAPAA